MNAAAIKGETFTASLVKEVTCYAREGQARRGHINGDGSYAEEVQSVLWLGKFKSIISV